MKITKFKYKSGDTRTRTVFIFWPISIKFTDRIERGLLQVIQANTQEEGRWQYTQHL
jgi:hypothetical protein